MNDNSPWKSILAKDIDEYIAMVPEDAKATLQNLRETIQAAAPKATEAIYYRIPTFIYHGPMVGFSASKNHCSLHLMSPSLMESFREELGKYDTTTATIRFPFDRPLPTELVTKLVRRRALENEERKKA